MKSGVRNELREYSIYYDLDAFEHYTVLSISADRLHVTIMWNDSKFTHTIPIYDCEGDSFVRSLSSLEKELL